MSRILDVLQMKTQDVFKEQMKTQDVFKFFAAGPHVSCTNFYLQVEQNMYKRKSKMKASTSSIFKRTWEKFLLTAYAIVIENPANGCSGILTSKLD